jgi:hypothetical protein
MERAEYIWSLFKDDDCMSTEKIKEFFPEILAEEFERLGYFDGTFQKVEVINELPDVESIDIDVYYQQNTSICKLLEESYDTPHGLINWGFKYAIHEDVIYRILFGYNASC